MMTLDNNIEKRNADTTKNNGTQRLVKNDNPSQKILCSTEIRAICIDTIPIEAQNFKRSIELYCCFIYTLNISLGKASSNFFCISEKSGSGSGCKERHSSTVFPRL